MSKNCTSEFSKTIGVIGFPFSKGQPRGGTEHGPSVLRDAGIVEKLKSIGNKVVDYGDLQTDQIRTEGKETLKNGRIVGAANRMLSAAVSKSLKEKETVLVLGGDHSMAIGSIHGHAQVEPDVVIVWVDAHADINTPLTSPSGNVHGMPLSFLLEEIQELMPQSPGFEWCKPCISVKNLVYIGLRDVDPAERQIIEKYGIQSFSMQEIDQFGIKEVVDRALKSVDPSGTRPIHVSFDVDSMDPSVAAATGTPVPGGLSLRESFYIAEELAKTGRMSVLDIAEVNPLLSNDLERKITVDNTVDVTSKFYGNRRQGNIPQDYALPVPDPKYRD